MKKLDRSNFLKKTSLSGAAFVTGGLLNDCAATKRRPESGGKYMGGFVAPKLATVRAAFIGVGARGGDHLSFLAKLPGTEVVAICDLYEDNVQKWAKIANGIGAEQRHQQIASYYGDKTIRRKCWMRKSQTWYLSLPTGIIKLQWPLRR